MAKIVPFAFPELSFSLLLSTTLYKQLATISAILYLTDLVTICYRIYSSRYYPNSSSSKFCYRCQALKLVTHFADAKFFHYLPYILEEPYDIASIAHSIWLIIGIYTIGRFLNFICHHLGMRMSLSPSSNLKEAVPEKSSWSRSWGCFLSLPRSNLSLLYSYLSLMSGYGIWIFVGGFVVIYKLVTTQFVWLLV